MRQIFWRWLTLIVKIGVAGGLVGYLWYQGKLDFSVVLLMTSSPWSMFAVVGLSLLTYSLISYRWVLLLRSQNIHLPFSWGQRVTYIGLFFNLVLPGGGLAGDALRMGYAVRSVPTHRPEAVLSLFVDRAIGMYGMFFICMMAILANPMVALSVGPLRFMSVIVIAFVIGLPLGALLFYYFIRRNSWLTNRVSQIQSNRIRWILTRFIDIISLYRDSLPQLGLAFILSVVAQMLALLALLLVAAVLNIGSLGHGDYLFATPWAWMANFIPLTPGGIGVGEAAFDQVCRWIDPATSGAAYGTIYLVFRILSMLGTLPGLVAYLFYRQDIHAVIKQNSVGQ